MENKIGKITYTDCDDTTLNRTLTTYIMDNDFYGMGNLLNEAISFNREKANDVVENYEEKLKKLNLEVETKYVEFKVRKIYHSIIIFDKSIHYNDSIVLLEKEATIIDKNGTISTIYYKSNLTNSYPLVKLFLEE